MKYREICLWGKEQLLREKITDGELDARLLLEHICHTNRNTLLVHGDRAVSEEEEKAYKEAIDLRKKHIPLQYITGVQDFMGLKFQVNKNVLIPRQDTETLVEEVMRYLHDGDRILDMCTGSGCILLSLLHYSNECTGVGVDVSEKVLEVAERNVAGIAGLSRPVSWEEGKVTLIQSDLFSRVPKEKYDIIVSNPPYIASKVIPTLMEEVQEHEPLSALDGKEDGLFFYRRIIDESREYLKKEGMLFFEIGYDQAEVVSQMMEEAGFSDVTVVKDLAGLDRVVYGMYLNFFLK